MNEHSSQSLQRRGLRSVTYIGHQDRLVSSRPSRHLHARTSSTASIVALVGLAVLLIAVASIILQLVVWEVLT